MKRNTGNHIILEKYPKGVAATPKSRSRLAKYDKILGKHEIGKIQKSGEAL